MRAQLCAALFLLASTAVRAQPAAAPSDEPTPSEKPGVVARDAPLKLGGLDLEVSITSSSGVFFAPRSYTNSLSLSFDPSFAIGRRFFQGRWLEALTVSGHLPVEIELTGSDPRFRGRGFLTASLLEVPEQAPITQAQIPPPGQVSGLVSHPVLLGDTWLGVTHAELFTIPFLELTFGAGLRAVLPTSTSSRHAGLITAASLGLFAERVFGPVTVGYSARPTKYFFTRSAPAIVALTETVLVNGREEPIWRPDSTGVANPDWAVVHGPSVSLELPAHLGLAVSYLLYHVAPLRSSSCTVDGVPLANPCLDGPLVGPVNPRAMRDDQWFTLEASWKPKALTVGLGLSTYRPLLQTSTAPRLEAGGCATTASCEVETRRSVAQPFFVADRNNYTTLYLSITTSAEQLAQSFSEKP